VGEVALLEQSRPVLVRLVDVALGIIGGVVFFWRWRAFTLGHRLLVGGRLIFHFKLGTLEVTVQIFDANSVHRMYPLPVSVE
jgi:hypothetical protein